MNFMLFFCAMQKGGAVSYSSIRILPSKWYNKGNEKFSKETLQRKTVFPVVP